MNNGLSKKLGHYGDHYQKLLINVWDIETKKIVFTGCQTEIGIFLGVSADVVRYRTLKRKRVKDKYALRLAKNNI